MPDSAAFGRDTEPFRRELFAHCYRMLGSVADAEDLVQETYLRAWRSYDSFEGRSSVRTWLYQIATNACLTALSRRDRRVLPSGLYDAEPDPAVWPEDAGPDVAWLDPVPDTLAIPEAADPAVIVTARESLRLALIASLQYLPPRQRAVLVLRDVLEFPAAQVAVMLDTTTASVKSALQRARARLEEVAPAADQITEPDIPQARALLDEYIAAFENADAAALERLLVEDVILEATPLRSWFSGRRACIPFLRDRVLVNLSEEDWDSVINVHLKGHFVPTRHAANYWREEAKAGHPVKAAIINTSSTSGLLGNIGQSNYGAAKAGIAAFTVIIAEELGRYGVRANAIAPAARTRMTESTPGLSDHVVAPTDASVFDTWDPANISPLVATLAMEDCDITGQVFFVQGGTVRKFQNWTMTSTLEKNDRWSVAELAAQLPTLLQ